MRFVPLLLVAISLVSCTRGVNIATLQQNTVTVMNIYSYGTGVGFVKDGRTFIWTVGHIYADDNTLIVNNYDEILISGIKIIVQDTDPAIDLALIELTNVPNEFPITSVEWETNLVAEGTEVYYVGNVGGLLYDAVTKGIISSTHASIESKHRYLANLTITFGSSGGGVYRADNGKCIGLLQALYTPDGIPINDLSYIIPFSEIKKFAINNNVMWAIDDSPIPADLSD